MSVKTVTGDLLASNAQMIVQQCNCVTIKSHGLSAAIAERFPYANLYAKRAGHGNSAAKNARSVPGTLVICTPDDTETGPFVACVMAQIAPGKPGDWCKQYGIDDALDDASHRLAYFRSGLKHLATYIIAKGIKDVAFPHLIGCGLAGGEWLEYAAAIDEFAEMLPPDVAITIYKLK